MAAAIGEASDTGLVGRQWLRSAVNFGVVAVARVRGAPAGEQLMLRCECGDTNCAAQLHISPREYQGLKLGRSLLVVGAHAPARQRASTTGHGWAVVGRAA